MGHTVYVQMSLPDWNAIPCYSFKELVSHPRLARYLRQQYAAFLDAPHPLRVEGRRAPLLNIMMHDYNTDVCICLYFFHQYDLPFQPAYSIAQTVGNIGLTVYRSNKRWTHSCEFQASHAHGIALTHERITKPSFSYMLKWERAKAACYLREKLLRQAARKRARWEPLSAASL